MSLRLQEQKEEYENADYDVSKKMPKHDVLFKCIFSNPQHPRTLIHLLNAILRPKKPIVSISFEKTELTPEYLKAKGSRLDVLAKTEKGTKINIEVQLTDEHNILDRAVYYNNKNSTADLLKGDNYREIKKTILICILDFIKFKKDNDYLRDYKIVDEKHSDHYKKYQIFFIELPKIKKLDKDSPITFWMEFLKNPDSEEMKKFYKEDPVLLEAKELYENAKANPEMREMIRIVDKYNRDVGSSLAGAREEAKITEKRDMALEMRKDGAPLSLISKYARLSEDRVKKLLDPDFDIDDYLNNDDDDDEL